MRWLLRLVVLAAVMWAGWWLLGARAIERGVRDAVAARGIAGEVAVAGFPNRWDLTLTGPRFLDPVTGLGWQAPFVQVFALTWKPWHLIAVLPPEQRFVWPGGEGGLAADRLRASLVLRPRTALPLDRLVVEGAGLRLSLAPLSAAPSQVSADSAVLATRRLPGAAETHAVALSVTGLAPDPAVLAALPEGRALPPRVDSLAFDAAVTLSAPLDRSAGRTRPHPTALDLRSAGIVWGALRVTAAGSLVADAQGLAEGRIDLHLGDWQAALDAMVGLGWLRPEMRPTWAEFARRLAEAGGTGAALDLPLTMARGRMALGPLPMGPAPRLVPVPGG